MAKMLRQSHDGTMRTSSSGSLSRRLEQGLSFPSVPATRRPLEELLTAMRKGADMLKHGRQGKPKVHFFRLADGDASLTWRSAKGTQRSVSLRAVFQVVAGQTTESFLRYPNPGLARRSFSLLYSDRDDGERTLDLTAPDAQTFELWFWGLQALVERLRGRMDLGKLPQLASPAATGALGLPFGSAAAAAEAADGQRPKPPLLLLQVSPRGIGGGTAQGRASGAVGVPVPEPAIGDCYEWGSNRARAGSSKLEPARCQPSRVEDTTHLDIIEVAVGATHAGLLTKGGEMYTWGDGAGGKLGLGHLVAAAVPQRVHTLWGQPVRHIAVSDSSSAAITWDGKLLTWGDAVFCGHGCSESQAQHIPRPVAGPLSEHVIVQVSCGTFHSAAVTSDGRLFTWGDGMGGRLGHGDQQPATTPRQVEALSGQAVTRVACGLWHTAAIAVPRPADSEGLAKLPFLERQTLRQKLAAVYEQMEQDGGALFTWGCAFEDAAKDHHRGCLGTGDRAGRLQPTKVGGQLEGLAVTCVAAGSGFTVAATSDGRSWQMGETGVGGKLPWEGSLDPCQVGGPLASRSVYSIAAGRHHVAALARPTGEASGGNVLFTWGRGIEGQLGMGSASDSSLPQPVTQLHSRRIVQVSCGGFRSMAVCVHDPGAEDTQERRKGYKAKMKHWFGGGEAGSPWVSPLSSPASHRAPERFLTRSASGQPGVGMDQIARLAPRSGTRMAQSFLGSEVTASGQSTPTQAGEGTRAELRLTRAAASDIGGSAVDRVSKQGDKPIAQLQDSPRPEQPGTSDPSLDAPVLFPGAALAQYSSRGTLGRSVVDVSPPIRDSLMRRNTQGLSTSLSGTTARPTPLPNARHSVLFQSIEDVAAAAAAAAADVEEEAASLARLRAQLMTQLAQIEQRQAVLAAETASHPEVKGSGTVLAASSRRRETPQGIRVKPQLHRRSRSGSVLASARSRTPAESPSAPLAPAVSAPAVAAAAGESHCEEVAPGVFLTIEPDGSGANRLTRIRFARQRFTKAAADAWWHAHKHELARRYALRGRAGAAESASPCTAHILGSTAPHSSPQVLGTASSRTSEWVSSTDGEAAGEGASGRHAESAGGEVVKASDSMLASIGLEAFRASRLRGPSSPEQMKHRLGFNQEDSTADETSATRLKGSEEPRQILPPTRERSASGLDRQGSWARKQRPSISPRALARSARSLGSDV